MGSLQSHKGILLPEINRAAPASMTCFVWMSVCIEGKKKKKVMIDNYIWVCMSHIRCRDGLIDLSVGTGVWFTFSALGKWGHARSFLSVCIPSYGVWWEPHCCFALKIVMFRFTHLQTVSSKREPNKVWCRDCFKWVTLCFPSWFCPKGAGQ